MTSPIDPAFDPANDAMDKQSPEAIRLSLHDWGRTRASLMDPIIAPHEKRLCDEISQIQHVFDPYRRDQIEVLAHMLGLSARACSELEAAWHCLRGCFIPTAHAAIRSVLEAAMTAVTFADPDTGPAHVAGYVQDTEPVSGVFRRFKVTAPKLRIPQAEVDFIDNYLKQYLHSMTHPAAASIKQSIVPLPTGVAIGNYFDPRRVTSYAALASNIANVAQRVRVLFQSAVPAAYLRDKM